MPALGELNPFLGTLRGSRNLGYASADEPPAPSTIAEVADTAETSPWEAQAARVRRRAPVRQPDPLSLALSQEPLTSGRWNLPGFNEARQQAQNVYLGEDYNPSSLLQMAIGTVGAPLVGPAEATAATLGAGAMRRAPAIRTQPESLFDLSPQRLRQVPDVPQFNLQRYEPPRGVPENIAELAERSNLARVNRVVKRGAEQGGLEWYNTEPLREAFVGELGAEKGMPAYQRYLDLVAATSPRSKVPENVRNASYWYSQTQQGLPVPQPIGKGGALSVSEPLPPPYGHIAQGLHAQNVKNVVEAGGWPVLQNPKPASFAQNLQGNWTPVTIDTHNARLLGLEADQPPKTGYGFLERAQQAEAAKLGMTPAQYQASAWIGGGEQTGLKSGAEPFVATVEDRIGRTAAKTGLSKAEVLRRFIRGQMPLIGLGGAAALEANRQD